MLGRWVSRFGGALAGLGSFALSIAAHAQQTANCPIAESEYGTDVERTFTDRTGRSAKIFFHLPPGHDPAKPTGILMYFHGNDEDPQDSYVAPLYLLQDRAADHGLVAAGLKSIGTRVDEDGTRRREWVNTDSNLFNDLLLSDFGGCFKLDRTRVYLEGASQGTCFLQAALTLDLWRDFQGGVLGLCGCWGYGEYDYPVNVPFLRGRFKVLVENTTEDFLYDQGVLGFDTYKYNFGVDVRADLDRPGGHCEASRVNTDAALEWMVGKTSYPDPDAGQPHWQVVDMQHNGLEEIAYDPAGRRFVFAVQRAEVSAEVLAEIERERRTTFVEDPAGFLDWRLENYPEYDVPPVLISSSSDFGASFERLGRRESTGSENLRDMAVAPDGSILVVAGLGVRKVNETTGMFDDFAFPQMLVYGLDRDDEGNLFAHGAVIGLQRSADSGATWSELTVPVANQYQQWTVQHRGGYLTVIGSDNQVHYSQDGGETFEAAALPAGTLVDFANYGGTFYALLDDGTLQVSADAGASWGMVAVPGDIARNVEVLANGDAVISTAAVAYDVGLAYRSADEGGSWQRERGAHNDARMEFAQGEGEQAMMVTTRGIFRYSTGDQLDLGEPPPPLTAPNGGAANGGGAGLSGQAGSTGGSGGTAGASGSSGSSTGGGTATGGGGSGNATSGSGGTSQAGTATTTDDDDRGRADSEGGCGCRTAPHRSSPLAAALAALGATLVARRRRARSARAST